MIILFNNEMLSALLRTVWSVIRMTPERHLHEIILVDDASNITGEEKRQFLSPLKASEDLKSLLWQHFGRRWRSSLNF